MDEKQFSARLAQLRTARGVSARDMSLSLGQNPGYINNIENGKACPSMSCFFYICEYLRITPMEFFDIENRTPGLLQSLLQDLKHLDERQLNTVAALIREMIRK